MPPTQCRLFFSIVLGVIICIVAAVAITTPMKNIYPKYTWVQMYFMIVGAMIVVGAVISLIICIFACTFCCSDCPPCLFSSFQFFDCCADAVSSV